MMNVSLFNALLYGLVLVLYLMMYLGLSNALLLRRDYIVHCPSYNTVFMSSKVCDYIFAVL